MPRPTLAGLVLVIAAGCSEGPIPIETAPVKGIASYQGKPLEGYRVFFYSDKDAAHEPASGWIDAEGRFSLSVREPDDGAIIGPNQIWFVYDPPLPEQPPGMEGAIKVPPPKVQLPPTYLKRETSGLSVEVPEDGLTDYKLELK
jgi:hypothetical protein